MEGFTIIDGIVALVIVVSAVLAYSRGFVREALSIVGWIAAAVLAYIFAPKAEPLIREIPMVGEFLGDCCELAIIAAFAAVFAAVSGNRVDFRATVFLGHPAFGAWRAGSGAWVPVWRGARSFAGCGGAGGL